MRVFLAAYTAVNALGIIAAIALFFLAAYTAVNDTFRGTRTIREFLSCLYGSELDPKTINLPSSKGSSAKARKNPLFAAISNPLI